MILKEFQSVARNAAVPISICLLLITMFGAPPLSELHTGDQRSILDVLLASRILLGGGFIRRWFLSLHLFIGCSIVPLLLALKLLAPQILYDRTIDPQYQAPPTRIILSSRFFAVAILYTLLLFAFHIGCYFWFSHEGKLIVFPVFMAIAYLTTLAGLFSLSLTMYIRLRLGTNLLTVPIALTTMGILQLPLFFNNPALSLLRFISPYCYASYILRVGPGDIIHFLHVATILFLFILLPYIGALHVVDDPAWRGRHEKRSRNWMPSTDKTDEII